MTEVARCEDTTDQTLRLRIEDDSISYSHLCSLGSATMLLTSGFVVHVNYRLRVGEKKKTVGLREDEVSNVLYENQRPEGKEAYPVFRMVKIKLPSDQ